MYPSRDLKVLAERRAYLQRRIEFRREECIEASYGVADGLERLMVWGRLVKIGGLMGAVGAGLFGRRRRPPEPEEDEDETDRESWGTKAVRWAPVALKAFRLFSSFV
jgi:hypothetical protein